MSNPWFKCKQFAIRQDKCAMKVGTDGVLLGAWTDVTNVHRVLDIGTGTGLIAIMLAQRTKTLIDAIEPEPDSCSQATENIKRCPWQDRIRIFNMTFQDYVSEILTDKSPEEEYDLIVTNPPYFIDSMKNPDKKKMQSRHADNLTGDDILNGSMQLLNKKGKLCIILPVIEAELFQKTAIVRKFHCTRKLYIKPTPEKDAKRILLQFEWEERSCEEETIVIESGGRHKYSDEYRELTKEFYLGF